MIEKKSLRPTYSTEFKAAAVAKCADIGVPRTSKELGVASSTLNEWRNRAEKASEPKSKPSYDELEKEVHRLRKELGYVNEINRILKKSTAIFSSNEMGDLR